MQFGFSAERWGKVKRNYGLWWEHRLDRPLLSITIGGRQPDRKPPKHPFRHFTARYPFEVSPEEVVDSWEYELSKKECLGDAFPQIWLNFGPGVAAAFMGANLGADDNTVWFHPREVLPPEKIRLEYDPENKWLKRVKDIAKAAGARWQGAVQVGNTDLGGTLDIVSTFRPGENLLLDLYDCPEEIKRLTWKIHELWWRYYAEIDAAMPHNPGRTAWTPIFSEGTYYMTQCDFNYMLGREMFEEFVKPELSATCAKLEHAFYHLDGPGQIVSLDSLLEIKDLDGVQWIPGAGQAPITEWPEVLRKIKASGKLLQLFCTDLSQIDTIRGQLGDLKDVILICHADCSRRDEALRILEKYGASQ